MQSWTDGRRSVRAPQDKKAGGSAGLEDLFLAAMTRGFLPPYGKWDRQFDTQSSVHPMLT